MIVNRRDMMLSMAALEQMPAAAVAAADTGPGWPAGFQLSEIALPDVTLRVRHGGSGPPLLLLHGHPQTHMMWGKIAAALARDFTLIMPDLRGYGQSSKPPYVDGHVNYSKRAMAGDAIALMQHFGFEQFNVAGHDRGARVAYRLALDHPQAVRRLAILDIIPTGDVWAHADDRFALGYWHWGFMAQPRPFPERTIARDPEYFFFLSQGGKPPFFEADAAADYMAAVRDPETVRAMCEDYRAGATIDRALDEADRKAGRTIACPVLLLWGSRGAVGNWYDVMAIWRRWAPAVEGQALDCGHFIAEERPAETLAAFQAFFGRSAG